jgi:DNA helicase-2/ATP-dependent DNA helicase PcrA
MYSSFWGDNLILFMDNFARTACIPVEQALRNASTAMVDPDRAMNIIGALHFYKEEQGLYDFTDMLEEFIRYKDPPRLEVLYVDEAQDLSELQWKMVEILSTHVKKLVVAGDDDQTIFTWGGASERFITLAGKVHLLKQSWRVPKAVHGLATTMIKQVVNRREKEWNPRDEVGTLNTVIALSMINPSALADGTSMFLARTGKMVQQYLIPYCRNNGLLYWNYETTSIRPSYATAISAWEELHQGNPVEVSTINKIYGLLPSEAHGFTKGVERGFKVQISGLAKEEHPIYLTLDELRKTYGLQAEGTWDKVFTSISEGDVKYIKSVIANGHTVTDRPKIQVSTIHRVKGGEASTVILMSDQAKPAERVSIDNPDEEVRVFYTAITRARQNLVIVQPARSRFFQGLFS